MNNPLLRDDELPSFSEILAEHIEPAISEIIAANLMALDALVKLPAPDWHNFVQPLHTLNDKLEKAWAPVSHMNAVVQNEALRAAHDACLPKLSDYYTNIGQHEGLFSCFQAIRNSIGFSGLSLAQKKTIDNALRDFRLSGIGLDGEKKNRYAEISSRLSDLSSRFSNNVLDATRAWTKLLDDKKSLAGLPETALLTAKSQARVLEKDGYLLTLDAPCYIAVMTYANDRELRREMYEAYVTRASECGPHAGKYDNTAIIDETLALRAEMAVLLGFASYADYSLATKMADSSQHVADFLWRLVEKSRSPARRELADLQSFAREQYGMDLIESWDLAWVSEKLREHAYAIDQEVLRQYFPLQKVLEGLFFVIKKLFSVDIVPEISAEGLRSAEGLWPAKGLWHEDARLYAIKSGDVVVARFYLDLYAREGKRGGAWMGDCRSRRILDDGAMQLPVAFMVCNFMSPVDDQPCLLTFNDVTTLFHEFGHGLHHMLTRVEYSSVSGINGVEWDAVELPSQFLENWCWHPEVIPLISSHYKSGEALPSFLLEKMLAARNFQSGLQMLRQLEFALFDFLLHQSSVAQPVQLLVDDVRSRVAVLIPPSFNRFQHSFTHIFAGGYAAGYYSYKWAEVLSADAFSAFEESDIFDDATSGRFLAEILERGGTEDAMSLFRRFRGREPSIDALLRHSGLAEPSGEAA